MITPTKLLSFALVAIMALTVISGAGVLRVQAVESTVITLNVPATVTVGQKFSITGDVKTQAGGPVTGGSVDIFRLTPGTIIPTQVGKGLSPNGFTITDTIGSTGTVQYLVVYTPATGFYASTATKTVTVNEAPTPWYLWWTLPFKWVSQGIFQLFGQLFI